MIFVEVHLHARKTRNVSRGDCITDALYKLDWINLLFTENNGRARLDKQFSDENLRMSGENVGEGLKYQ